MPVKRSSTHSNKTEEMARAKDNVYGFEDKLLAQNQLEERRANALQD